MLPSKRDEEEQRDEILVLNINKWLHDDILPQEYHELDNWDIFESLHDDNISIVHIGSTQYKQTEHSKVTQFLQDDDDDDDEQEEEEEDDDIKQSNKFQVEVEKMHQFRIVFDFTDFAFDEQSNCSTKPTVLAIYKKNDDNTEWQQIFQTKQFNDDEIHSLCLNEDALDHEEAEQCDLSFLFASMSKRQLLRGIKTFLNHQKQTDGQQWKLLTNKIDELQHVEQLGMFDKDMLIVIIAKIVAIDGDQILRDFNALMDDEVDELFNTQFKQNMVSLKHELNDTNFDAVLDDIEQMVQTAQSLHHRKQSQIALHLLQQICQQFLIDFIVRLHGEDDDDYELEVDIVNHHKLKYRIGDIENALEKVCNDMRCEEQEEAEILSKLQDSLKQWQKQLLPMFGPLFSDNIRCLDKKLKGKRKHDEKNNNSKKRKLTDSCTSDSGASNKRTRRQ